MPASDLLSSAYFGPPATHVPTDIWDVAGDRLSQVFRNDMDSPIGTDYYLRMAEEGRAFAERNDLIKQRFGRDIVAEVRKENPQAGADFLIAEYQKRTDRLIDEGRAADMSAWAGIRKAEEIEAATIDRAQVAEIEAQRTTARAESAFAAVAGNLIGGLGELIDPINIATLPLGMGASRGILKAALTDGVINMGVETVQSPSRAEWMRDIGFKYGLSEIATDVVTAGVGGTALSALIRGGAKGLGKLTGESERTLRRIAADPANGSEVRAAASYMERVAHIDENMPPPRLADDARLHEVTAAHRGNLQETQDAFRHRREPVYSEDIPFDVPPAPRAEAPQARRFEPGDAEKGKYSGYTRPTPQELRYMEGAAAEVRQAEKGGIVMLEKDGQGSTPDVITARENTFPDWFRQMNRDGESLSRDYVDKVLAKVREGAPLGKKEIRVAQALFDVARGLREENARQILNFRAERMDALQKQAGLEMDTVGAREAAREMADPYLDPMPNAARTLADDVRAGAESEMMEAAQADFARLVRDEPDFSIVMEDGSIRSMAELADELAADGAMLEAVTICGVG